MACFWISRGAVRIQKLFQRGPRLRRGTFRAACWGARRYGNLLLKSPVPGSPSPLPNNPAPILDRHLYRNHPLRSSQPFRPPPLCHVDFRSHPLSRPPFRHWRPWHPHHPARPHHHCRLSCQNCPDQRRHLSGASDSTVDLTLRVTLCFLALSWCACRGRRLFRGELTQPCGGTPLRRLFVGIRPRKSPWT